MKPFTLYNIIGIPFGFTIAIANIYNNEYISPSVEKIPLNHIKIALMTFETIIDVMFCTGKGILYYSIWPTSLPFTIRRIYKYKKENDIEWIYPAIRPADMLIHTSKKYHDWKRLWLNNN